MGGAAAADGARARTVDRVVSRLVHAGWIRIECSAATHHRPLYLGASAANALTPFHIRKDRLMPKISSSELKVNAPIEAAAPDATLIIAIDPANPMKVGTYTFQLVVTDDSGNPSK